MVMVAGGDGSTVAVAVVAAGGDGNIDVNALALAHRAMDCTTA